VNGQSPGQYPQTQPVGPQLQRVRCTVATQFAGFTQAVTPMVRLGFAERPSRPEPDAPEQARLLTSRDRCEHRDVHLRRQLEGDRTRCVSAQWTSRCILSRA
jgi:hypothetical protein